MMVCLCVFRVPEGLQLLVKLYVERSHSVWKEPEVTCANMYITCGVQKHTCTPVQVLTWLEANCRAVVTRADSKDPLISEYRDKYAEYCFVIILQITVVMVFHFRAPNRYTGVPTNIYRHILISDLDRVVAALPPVCHRSY